MTLQEWLLPASIVATAIGWWVAHHFSARRDLANERRKLKISYLLEAYRLLDSALYREGNEFWSKLETAVSDIQLLGSPHQASLARTFAQEMAEKGTSDIDDLIFDLRHSLRTELGLEPISQSVIHFRFIPSQSNGGVRPLGDESMT